MEFVHGPIFHLQHSANIPRAIIEMTRTNVRYTYAWNDIRTHWAGSAQRSPSFSIGPNSRIKWSLVLYPNGIYSNSAFASLYLCCQDSSRTGVKAKFRFHLAHPRLGTVSSPEMKEYHIFEPAMIESSCGYSNMVKDLDYYSDISFVIHCDIELFPGDENIGAQGAGEPFKMPNGRLLDDMVTVFTARKHTDFVITNGGLAFPVHKAILAARSSVFASMFDHDTQEQRRNCVDIEDTTPEALEEMLRFIYTDKVMGIKTVARDLLAVAEKYALDNLKVMCEEALRGMLTVQNAAEILVRADLYRADRLKKRTIDFINVRTAEVMNTPGFKSMANSYPHLTVEILAALARKKY